jgi:DNA-binding MarR family transcriptional regulator
MTNDKTPEQALAELRAFLESIDKHPDLKVQDIGIIAYLMTHRAAGHDVIYPSHLTIANAFNCDTRTVSRSLARLVKIGYLSIVRRGSRGMTNLYSLNFAKLKAAA